MVTKGASLRTSDATVRLFICWRPGLRSTLFGHGLAMPVWRRQTATPRSQFARNKQLLKSVLYPMEPSRGFRGAPFGKQTLYSSTGCSPCKRYVADQVQSALICWHAGPAGHITSAGTFHGQSPGWHAVSTVNSRNSSPSLMSSATPLPVENIPGDRDHRSGVCDHLITIIPEPVIILIPELESWKGLGMKRLQSKPRDRADADH
jgi:hypothetical protein